jgi:hypothetical protein
MKKHFTLVLFLLIFFSSCSTPSYLLSQLHTDSHPYYTIPVRADSIKSATYANAHFTTGAANYNLRDNTYDFQGGFSRSHNFGHFQAYYAASIVVGDYDLHDYSNNYVTYPQQNRYFGAYGFNGGIDLAETIDRHGSEFRIGAETSLQREFGDYLKFRKSLPDSSVDILDKEKFVKTLGIYAEVIKKLRRSGNELGYKLGVGSSAVSRKYYRGDSSQISPAYFSNTFHFTKNNFTTFAQFNVGIKAFSFQIGGNYRLGKRKRADNSAAPLLSN